MNITILQITDPQIIEEATKMSRGSEKIENLSQKVFEWQHFGLLEHTSITLKIEGISRACCDQFTRYRHVSFVVESQRYVDPTIQADWYVIPNSITDNIILFKKEMERLANLYKQLVNSNVPKEDARFVLPMATKTSLVCTMNMREIFHILKQRLDPRAQWEIRAMANSIVDLLQNTTWKNYIDAFINNLKLE